MHRARVDKICPLKVGIEELEALDREFEALIGELATLVGQLEVLDGELETCGGELAALIEELETPDAKPAVAIGKPEAPSGKPWRSGRNPAPATGVCGALRSQMAPTRPQCRPARSLRIRGEVASRIARAGRGCRGRWRAWRDWLPKPWKSRDINGLKRMALAQRRPFRALRTIRANRRDVDWGQSTAAHECICGAACRVVVCATAGVIRLPIA